MMRRADWLSKSRGPPPDTIYANYRPPAESSDGQTPDRRYLVARLLRVEIHEVIAGRSRP
jgi:hypothetical protein